MTCLYSSLAAETAGHEAGEGIGWAGAWTRCSTRSINASFQARRSICQTPSAIRAAKAVSERTVSQKDGSKVAARSLTARPSCLARHGPQFAHFIPLIWWIGIMLLLRWFITHSEPDSAITTMTMVKISAIMLQPFSDFVFMCRK
ncbi:hypothetical protein ABIF39_001645 [Bradyrhizobium diazoefficiens]